MVIRPIMRKNRIHSGIKQKKEDLIGINSGGWPICIFNPEKSGLLWKMMPANSAAFGNLCAQQGLFRQPMQKNMH